jgi:DNA-binding transcriptional LysR family regulator
MPLGAIDLNLLVALDALLSERNVTRAAERTSIGQPAMSASLARLRKHFDDQLLVREGRQLRLTPLAESLLEPTRNALNAAQIVMDRSPGFDPTRDQRSFTMLASDYVSVVLLRSLLGLVAREAPGVRLNITPVRADYGDRLRKGYIDLFILPTETVGDRFSFPHKLLFTDRYVLAADKSNPVVNEQLTVEKFGELPYVGVFTGGTTQSIAETQLDSLGVQRRLEVSTQSFVVAPFLLAGTPLVSLVQERLARHVARAAKIRIVDPPVPLQPIHEALYWNPRNTDDPAHRWLREQIIALAAAL